MSSCRVIGTGNPLRGDNAIGCRVITELKKCNLPEDIELIDLGTGSFALLELLTEIGKIVLVDAVLMKRPPGDIIRLTGKDFLKQSDQQDCFLHGNNLGQILQLATVIEPLPEIVFLGMQAAGFDPGKELSLPLRKRLPKLLRLIRVEIGIFRQ